MTLCFSPKRSSDRVLKARNSESQRIDASSSIVQLYIYIYREREREREIGRESEREGEGEGRGERER